MIFKKVLLGTVIIMALGTSAIAIAKENDKNSQASENSRNRYTYSKNSMYRMMGQYGESDLVDDFEEENFAGMDGFMENLSDDEFQKMIDIMRTNGYVDMAILMERIGREDMIKMHEAMGRTAGCHR